MAGNPRLGKDGKRDAQLLGPAFRSQQSLEQRVNERFPQYDALKAIDKRRKELLHTQACDGAWKMLRRVSGTVLPDVFKSPLFWFCMMIYVLTRMNSYLEVIPEIDFGDFRALATLGLLLSFLINQYVTTCISRLFQTNADSMKLVAKINNFALLLRGILWKNETQQRMTRRLLDYMSAAQAFAYIGFSDEYSVSTLWEGFNNEFGVLTHDEVKKVLVHKETGGSRYRECLAWCMEELDECTSDSLIPAPIAAGLHNRLTDFQDAIQALYDFRYQPIPFCSQHLLVLFIYVYLPMQTFEIALQAEVVRRTAPGWASSFIIEAISIVVAVLSILGFQGLFQIGAFIEEPYGGDLSDARVTHFCRMTVLESRKILGAGSGKYDQPPLERDRKEMTRYRQEIKELDIDISSLSSTYGLRAVEDLLFQAQSIQGGLSPGCHAEIIRDSTKSTYVIRRSQTPGNLGSGGGEEEEDEGGAEDEDGTRVLSSEELSAREDSDNGQIEVVLDRTTLQGIVQNVQESVADELKATPGILDPHLRLSAEEAFRRATESEHHVSSAAAGSTLDACNRFELPSKDGVLADEPSIHDAVERRKDKNSTGEALLDGQSLSIRAIERRSNPSNGQEEYASTTKRIL